VLSGKSGGSEDVSVSGINVIKERWGMSGRTIVLRELIGRGRLQHYVPRTKNKSATSKREGGRKKQMASSLEERRIEKGRKRTRCF